MKLALGDYENWGLKIELEQQLENRSLAQTASQRWQTSGGKPQVCSELSHYGFKIQIVLFPVCLTLSQLFATPRIFLHALSLLDFCLCFKQ